MITGLNIIKALRVTDGFRPEDALDFDAHAILLDSYSNKHRGGTGETFDWDIAKHVCGLVGELYLAGGLSAENVGSAISEVRPYAVDVCSSVESRPGIKDPNKLKAFINASRNEI
jgi:phosphoribosylanthranilate isomerase